MAFDYRAAYEAARRDHSDIGNKFEQALNHLYKAVLKHGDGAIDVGAHTGKHSVPMSHAIGATGKLWSFEPIPNRVPRLTANLTEAGLSNFTVYPYCVGDKAQAVNFTYLPGKPGQSAIHIRYESEGDKAETFEIPMVRLDDVLATETTKIRFMKTDAEGSELITFLGARDTIGKHRPVVHFECAIVSIEPFGDTPEDYFNFFAPQGYFICDILGNPIRTIDDFKQSLNAAIIYDYVACDISDWGAVVSNLTEFWSADTASSDISGPRKIPTTPI